MGPILSWSIKVVTKRLTTASVVFSSFPCLCDLLMRRMVMMMMMLSEVSAEDVRGKAHHQTSIRYSLKLKCRNNLGRFCALNVLCFTVLFSFCPGQSAFEVVFSVVTLAEPDAGIKNRVAMSSKYLDRYRKNSGVNIGQLGFVPVLTMCKYDGEDVFTVVSQEQRTTKPNDNICAWYYKFKDQSDGIAFDILFA